MKVRDLNIGAGKLVVALHEEDARRLGMHTGDRIGVIKKNKHIHALVDIATNDAIPKGTIGCFDEVMKALNMRNGAQVNVQVEQKPLALKYIKDKLEGKALSQKQYVEIMQALVEGRLSDAELSFFVSAGFVHGFTDTETAYLTRAMIDTGETLKFSGIVVDKHCTGGVAGNRTTPIIVAILAAAGVKMPKTSSRAITSPAGTADTMEVLAPVTFSKEKMERIVKKTKGCVVWGGAMNLAPADDKIIQVERTLSIDAEGQLLASILAKKGSVGSTHVLIDIPVGTETKITSKKQGNHLKKKFETLGKKLGMNIQVMMSDGNQPIGNGIGPALEAKDVLKVLQQSDTRPLDLEKKATAMAGMILETAKKCKKGKGTEAAKAYLTSGKALKTFRAIIKAQGGNAKIESADIPIGKYTYDYKAQKDGIVKDLNNKSIARVAKFAGAPQDKGAGVFLHKHEKEKVKKGELILTIHAENKEKLGFAKNQLIQSKAVNI